jgi:hypothetical protein
MSCFSISVFFADGGQECSTFPFLSLMDPFE